VRYRISGLFAASYLLSGGPLFAQSLPVPTVVMTQPYISDTGGGGGVLSYFAYDPVFGVSNGQFWLAINFATLNNGTYADPNNYLGGSTGTEFTPQNLSSSQRAANFNANNGGVEVQGEGNTAGLFIVTGSQSSGSGAATVPTIYAVVAEYNFPSAVQPWYAAGSGNYNIYAGVTFSINVQVPSATANDAPGISPSGGNYSAAYSTATFIIKDQSSGLWFWYQSPVYDHRGNSMNYSYIQPDNTFNVPTVVGQMLTPGQLSSSCNPHCNAYSTPVWGSAGFQPSTWSGYRTIAFGINGSNLLNAINEVKTQSGYASLSTNLSDYVVQSIIFDIEAYFGGANAEIGTSFQGMTVTTTPAMPQPFFWLYSPSYNRHFFTTSADEANLAISEGYTLEEGNAGQLYPTQATSGLIELHRYYRASDHDHLYTTNPGEVTPSSGYVEEQASEGGAGYLPNSTSPLTCSVVLYRTYSQANGHFYTTSASQASSAGTLEAAYCINP
jgi:hypothetical protein